MSRKKEPESPEHINYSLLNPNKISFEFLKSHLWSAADILRGSLDPSEYRQPVMTLLFIKRLNDTFEENADAAAVIILLGNRTVGISLEQLNK